MRRDSNKVLEPRFAVMVRDWLSTLEAGWRGTAADLADALKTYKATNRRFGVFVPGAGGVGRWMLASEPVIVAAGFRLTFARTAKERIITLTKAAGS